MSNNRSLSSLLIAVVSVAATLLQTHRSNADEIAKVKADADKRISDLEEQLREAQADDAELENLRPELEAFLAQAAAAKPPTPEQVEEVGNIAPAGSEPKGEPASEEGNPGEGVGTEVPGEAEQSE